MKNRTIPRSDAARAGPPVASAPRRVGSGLRAGPALAILAAGWVAACGPERPPNVLLVVLDTARADAVAVYGGPPARTPVFDRLAAEGVLFEEARSTSAWTVPAHGSLFTGLYPSRHGAHHEHPALAADQVTLAELLAPTHATAGFSENPNIGEPQGFAQGFEHFEPTWRSQRTAADVAPTDRRVLAWLAGRDPARPFFLFVNFMAPHLPYAPPPEFEAPMLPPGADAGVVERLRRLDEWGARQVMVGQLALAPPEVEVLRALYRAEVAFADARVGGLVAALDRAGELARTLVVVTSDHGENLADHGLMEHQFCLYETLLRVPLVLRLPGVFAGGEVRRRPVQLLDLAPTILEVAGVPRERWPPFEGTSLLAGEPPAERPVVAEYMRPLEQRWRFERVDPGFDFDRFDRRLTSVQIRGWKLIRSDRGEAELYHLPTDPGETRDRAGERPEIAARLAAWLDAFAAAAPGPVAGEPPELDPETRDALRALGYLE